jgi:hypothetical protein
MWSTGATASISKLCHPTLAVRSTRRVTLANAGPGDAPHARFQLRTSTSGWGWRERFRLGPAGSHRLLRPGNEWANRVGATYLPSG